MAGFLQQHTGRSFRVPPISSDKTVALMYISNTFFMINRNNISQSSVIDQFFDCNKKWCISKYVTNNDFTSHLFRIICNFIAFLRVRGYWFSNKISYCKETAFSVGSRCCLSIVEITATSAIFPRSSNGFQSSKHRLSAI